jgi:hypothetical protein
MKLATHLSVTSLCGTCILEQTECVRCRITNCCIEARALLDALLTANIIIIICYLLYVGVYAYIPETNNLTNNVTAIL